MKNIDQKLKDAWLGIDVDEEYLFNPMEYIYSTVGEDKTKLPEKLAWLMTRPEYFSFVCKHIFNIEISPTQALILADMWNRKFPMLVGSRGFGKMTSRDELIRIKDGWTTMEKVQIGDYVYGGDGKLTKVIQKTDLQRNLNFYKITLRDGRSIEVCEDHLWKVWDKNKNRSKDTDVWTTMSTKQMAENYFWIRKDSKSKTPKMTKEYRFALPINKALSEETGKEYPIHPYVLGVILGDGGITSSMATITSIDKDLINRFENLLPYGYILKPHVDGKTYRIIRSDKSIKPFHTLLSSIGINRCNSHTKFIPEFYLRGSYEQRMELLKGLMDTDGCSSNKVIEYYTVSNQLSKDFLDLARSLGLHCKHEIKQSWYNGNRYADCNRIRIYTDQPIFSLQRKLDNYIEHIKSKAGQSKYDKVFITNIEYAGKNDGYCIKVDNEDSTYLTKDYIVTHNSFILSLYCMLRTFFLPERKIVVVGAAFRQSKVLYEYSENIWRNAPVLRDLCDQTSGCSKDVDRCTVRINRGVITFLPLGDGQKIRGQRANDIIADEFASIPRDIFENVVAGFAAVSSSPIEKIKARAKEKRAKELGVDLATVVDNTEFYRSNQIILSGTAYYDFNHYAEYWKRYHQIVRSKGDRGKLAEIFKGEVPDDFKWQDYAVYRIPVELLPVGYMDEGQIARAKATVHAGIYQMEYGACFSTDSKGFFKRSLIESCVCSEHSPIVLGSGEVFFEAVTRGNPQKQYIIGVDPASEVDNFSIVVIELNEDHRRVVYSWTTTRERHRDTLKANLTSEDNFYAYCARKIRNLMKVFPTAEIALDPMGGGVTVMEALHDKDKLEEKELAIWPVIDPEKASPTDDEPGLHIIRLCNFSSAQWNAEANHGLRKDMEDKVLIFPFFDAATIGLSLEEDKRMKRYQDTLEDCVLEIESLKDELALIVISQTQNGRERWDTPDTRSGKKNKLRKDRYSALLMANDAARRLNIERVTIKYDEEYYNNVGFATKFVGERGIDYYSGPQWFSDAAKDLY